MEIAKLKKIISKKTFQDYLEIQYEGNFNMFTEADYVAEMLGISLDDYFLIINNYNKLKTAYNL